MALEIEIKLTIDDPQALRARLRAAGAAPGPAVFEVNRIFDTCDEALRQQGSALRIRHATPAGGGAATAILTYKSAGGDSEFKAREELETTVGDPAVMVSLLARLGYREVIAYEKRRETWHVGECEVVIDELPQLGWFAEIEGPSDDALRACRSLLELDDAQAERASYIALTSRHGDTRAGVKRLAFA
jgi:adenylate cyclase class 2